MGWNLFGQQLHITLHILTWPIQFSPSLQKHCLPFTGRAGRGAIPAGATDTEDCQGQESGCAQHGWRALRARCARHPGARKRASRGCHCVRARGHLTHDGWPASQVRSRMGRKMEHGVTIDEVMVLLDMVQICRTHISLSRRATCWPADVLHTSSSGTLRVSSRVLFVAAARL